MQVTIRDVRQRLGAILDELGEGEEIVVTRRGTPVAAIVPAPDDAESGAHPLGVAAYAGALARLDGLAEAVAAVVSLRAVARDREPPEIW